MYNDHKKINSTDYVFDFVFPVVVLLLEHTLNTHILLRRERSFSLGMAVLARRSPGVRRKKAKAVSISKAKINLIEASAHCKHLCGS